MLGRIRNLGGAAVTAIALGLGGGADDADATTFCVPSVAVACPGTAGAVSEADLEKAMSLQGSDGQADTILLGAATYTEGPAPFEPAGGSGESLEPEGSDPLTIAGAGRAATVITSGATNNVYIVNLASNNTRAITMRDLTISVPATVVDGGGVAIQTEGDVLERVDLVSRNEGSDGLRSAGTGTVFRGGELRGEGPSGSVMRGLIAGSAGSTLLVEDVMLRGASWSLYSSADGAQLTARRVTEVGTRTYGAIATAGTISIENSVLGIDDGIGLYSSALADSAAISADHVTIVNNGPAFSAIDLEKSGGLGDTTVTVSNSILRGFSSGYKVTAAAGPGIGHASLAVRYSNLPASGTNSGLLDLATGNIDADPLFNADLSLAPGSPSIDAGDPAAGGLTTDFLGALRPTDGNGDGIARRDQGAFEYQPPAKPGGSGEPAPAPAPDTRAPQTKILKGPGGKLARGEAKFKLGSSEAGSRFLCKLDRGKVARCGSSRRYRKLKPGRHVFKVWAIDAAGNKDATPAKRRFRVPGPDR